MEKRIVTKKLFYGALVDYIAKSDIELTISKEDEKITLKTQDIVDYLNTDIELLNKKRSISSEAQTLKNQENEKLVSLIKSELSRIGEPVTIAELLAQSPTLANYKLINGLTPSAQKINYIFMNMLENKDIIKTTIKRRNYYSLNEDVEG